MLRIGIVTNYHLRKIGGAEAAIDRLATFWHEAGHDVRLISAPTGRGENQRHWQPAYECIDIKRPRSTRFGLGRITRTVLRCHRERAFDVLLASDVYWPGHVAHAFWRQTGARYVLWSHGSDVMHGSRFLKKPLVRRRMEQAIEHAHGLACISRYIRDRLHSLGRPGGIERIIPNGWPDEWAGAAKPRRVFQGAYLFAMGRMVRLKGFQTLIEAYARLRANHPGVSLVIAGDGEYRDALIAQAATLGLPVATRLPAEGEPFCGVCMPGMVRGEAKRSLVCHAELGVCPSIRQEPMALVLFEMLACGTPVVASRVGGTPDIVRPGVNGEWFAAGDIGQLTDVLSGLLANWSRRKQLADRAAASVAPYRWSQVAQRHLELLDEVSRGTQPGAMERQREVMVRGDAHGCPTERLSPVA